MELKELTGYVLVLVLVAILIGVGLTVLGVMGTEVRTDVTETNDPITAVDNACTALANSYITTTGASFVNGTNGASIPGSCYTWDKTGRHAASCITLASGGSCLSYNNSVINGTYTYGSSNSAVTTLSTSITAIGGVANWFAIVIVVIVAAVIIGLVVTSFGRK